MTILAFQSAGRPRGFGREIDHETETGLREIVASARRGLDRIRIGSENPASELEKLRLDMVTQYREVELLQSDLAEMRALQAENVREPRVPGR